MKSILITGCSSGIGLDAALAFRDAGWLVIASCRKEVDCEIMRGTHRMQSVRIDYEDGQASPSGFAATLKITGQQLDVLFNNGAYAVPALVEDLPTEALRAIFRGKFLWLAHANATRHQKCGSRKRPHHPEFFGARLRPTEIQGAHIMLPNLRLRD